MLKENNVRTGFFEVDDYKALMAQAAEHIRPILAFACETGWRKSEILSLKWHQVDLRAKTVRLDHGQTKNHEGRLICLSDELYSLLQDLFTKRTLGCDHVFQNQGKPIKDIRRGFDSANKRAKLGKRLFHDFRRTAIRNMVRNGIPEQVAMKISGHKTRSVFERYNIVSEDDLREAAKKMGGNFIHNVA
jgi:integrase